MEEEIEQKKLKRQRALFGSTILGLLYLMVSSNYGTPNPIKWDKIERERAQREEQKKIYEFKVDSTYKNLLNDSLTFEDSLNFYLYYNLPLKFEDPSLEQKKEVLKQNKLEVILE